MTAPQTAPYGTWRSPIRSDDIVSSAIGLGAIVCDGEDIYWLEGRPSEGGRNVLVRRSPDGSTTEVTPPPFNVRTRVHEYGGGAFLIAGGAVYFVNFADQRLYRHPPGADPEPLTPDNDLRYADFVLDAARERLICVCEDHSRPDSEPVNAIAAVSLNDGRVTVLASGSDFYASPALSPDGSQLAWVEWNHPNMPWDDTRLQLADIESDGTLSHPVWHVGHGRESLGYPKWSPNGLLYYISDRTNWWNLYRRDRQGNIEPLYPLDAEFAAPHWVFGQSHYDFLSSDRIICAYTQQGSWQLAVLNLATRQLAHLDTPYTEIASLHTCGERTVFIGGSPTAPTAAVLMEPGEVLQQLQVSTSLDLDPGYLSEPEAIAFPTSAGDTAYGWYYPPRNRDFVAPADERPPLLVKSHGGPTAATSAALSLKIQYWTSRGFGFVDVNYRGSTGYGRDYRKALHGRWGVYDLDDCANAALYLCDRGDGDRERLAISGGSAGGYTTLAALAFRNTFRAGCSRYGVSDLAILATETHKFESRYLDGLVGRYPEEKAIYEERSPLFHVERLSCPAIFFQGLEDKIVPPNQAEMMVEALDKQGLPVAYVAFEGEQHGFRRAENIKRAIDGEFYFYSRVFGFEPAEAIEPVEIRNL